jgi:diguanylate cyclase (GGDEF)-like protein
MAGTAMGWAGLLVAVMTATMLVYTADVLIHPLPEAVSEGFQKFASGGIFFLATALCIIKGRRAGDERWAWWLFGITMSLYGLGQSYYALVLWDATEIPFPSIADGFWLVFYIPAYAALFLLLRRRSGSIRRGAGLDALVAGLGVGGTGAALVLQQVLANSSGSTIAIATNLAYPVGDLGLLAMVVAAMTVTGWRGAGAWRWIAASFVAFALADSVYLVQVAHDTYTPGRIVDLGWPVAAVLMGIAAWRPDTHGPATVRAGGFAVPAVSGLVALALLIIDHFERLNLLALGLGSASICVIIFRLYLTLKQSRHEAATDPMTGLGNRRRLSRDLARHLTELDPERPLMLTLFDLDGFKLYNDSFGHLAGDQLLQRLGGRLSELVVGHGTAYRMGGDEFCALWNLSEVDQASVTAMEAVEALSEHGEAFSIGCSYGSVLMPNETADPTEALRIADRRMYSRKNSGRVSAGRQSADVLLRALGERDSDLGEHLDGVADLVVATSLRLGLSEDDVELARQTALLHDVGKVAIPDEILGKPRTLTAAEWGFIEQHTLIGERIIAAAPALARVAKLVRSTHERFDGSGYPDRLAGEDIPLIARIVSVCDAYDAMTTTRPYRVARLPAAAIAELHACAGTQFDAQVVEAFVTSLAAKGAPILERTP